MKFDVVRAWKDEKYRKSLSSEQLATLPECPAGEFELTDADLEAVQGGWEQQPECCERQECNFNLSATAISNCTSFNCHPVVSLSQPGLVGALLSGGGCPATGMMN